MVVRWINGKDVIKVILLLRKAVPLIRYGFSFCAVLRDNILVTEKFVK